MMSITIYHATSSTGEFEIQIGATGMVKIKVRRTIPQTLCDVPEISASLLSV